MKGIYRIGTNPRIAIPVQVADGGVLVATEDTNTHGVPLPCWVSSGENVCPAGQGVDILGACSIVTLGFDPAAASGQASFEIVSQRRPR